VNPNLLYSILRSHKRFEDIGTFTLSKGLREIHRIKLAKEDAERVRAGKDKGKASDAAASTFSANESLASLALSDEGQGPEKGVSRRGSSEAASLSQYSQSEDNLDHPLTIPPTPTAASTPTSFLEGRPDTISEKARGKMRETVNSPPVEIDPELQRIAAAGVGRNGFVPTQEWVTSWQQGYVISSQLASALC